MCPLFLNTCWGKGLKSWVCPPQAPYMIENSENMHRGSFHLQNTFASNSTHDHSQLQNFERLRGDVLHNTITWLWQHCHSERCFSQKSKMHIIFLPPSPSNVNWEVVPNVQLTAWLEAIQFRQYLSKVVSCILAPIIFWLWSSGYLVWMRLEELKMASQITS